MNKNLTATILIIIGIGIYFTVTRAMIADAEVVKAKNDQLISALNNAGEIIKARNDVTLKYNSIPEKDRIKLDKMIPSAVDNIRLVIDLNNIALRNHFAIADVKASVPNKGKQGAAAPSGMPAPIALSSYVSEPILDKVDISFKATATYQQFIDFLQDIEVSLRVMDLTSLKLRANDTGTYDFDVTFQTYWLRQ